MKNIISLIRDHSGSMSGIRKAAARDYNANVVSIRDSSIANNQNTLVNVIELGYGSTAAVRTVIENASVTVLQPLTESAYTANGRGTPLWDAVGEAIKLGEKHPDFNDPETSFLVMTTTDGGENASHKWTAEEIAAKIAELQRTDRWTFVFRVPRGDARHLISQGIPAGNIMEWEQSERGVQVAQAATTQAFGNYFTDRSKGVRSTNTFYANMTATAADVKRTMEDISKDVMLWPVSTSDNGTELRPFVEARLAGQPLLKGAAFYQLTKTESKVQDYKKIVLRDKTTHAIFGGDGARQMLGLPDYGDIRLAPGQTGNFDVFIQSTSVNRKLTAGSQCLYWPDAGVPYSEGPSAR